MDRFKLQIRMTQYGGRGWQWTINSIDLLTDEEHSRDYRTNSNGEGLWQLTASPNSRNVEADGTIIPVYEWRQIEGTTQFSLPAKRPAAYAAIRRYFQESMD